MTWFWAPEATRDMAITRTRTLTTIVACDGNELMPLWARLPEEVSPQFAEPSSEPPQNVTAAKTFDGVLARHSMALCIHQQNSENNNDDCGLSPKRPGELRPKADREIFSEKQP